MDYLQGEEGHPILSRLVDWRKWAEVGCGKGVTATCRYRRRRAAKAQGRGCRSGPFEAIRSE
jgi:hypothetical protein